ncbi:MAG: GNAT family N-acetyltransferase [Rhodocyclaceae bacterium]|nr:GNAT family N-acetyltransferase [Rhodocyclaceae bacterium]
MLVLPLNDRHDRKSFDCGDVDLNGWLKKTARQHKEKGISSAFISVAHETSVEILGFYAISLAELVNTNLPAQYGKRLPSKVPVFRIGRLATALGHQGKGIGAFLLFDAIDRAARISGEVGGIGIVVNAKHSAVDFYQRYGFEQMADHPQNLFLPF